MGAISSTTSGPCLCCAASAMTCRTRGGIASMPGARGLLGGTPPNIYNTISYSLSGVTNETYSSHDGTCSGDSEGTSSLCNFSGTGNLMVNCDPDFNAWSGVVTASGDSGCSGLTLSPLGVISNCDGANMGCSDLSDTSRVAAATGSCHRAAGYTEPSSVADIFGFWGGNGGLQDNKFTSGSGSVTLSNKDTEEAAIARLQDCASWSDWLAATSTRCLARYQTRTSTFFNYQDAQWQVSQSGLLPSHTYTVAVTMQRSLYGAGSYSIYSTDTVSVTTDGAGNLLVSADTPNDEGYDTYADTYTITP